MVVTFLALAAGTRPSCTEPVIIQPEERQPSEYETGSAFKKQQKKTPKANGTFLPLFSKKKKTKFNLFCVFHFFPKKKGVDGDASFAHSHFTAV